MAPGGLRGGLRGGHRGGHRSGASKGFEGSEQGASDTVPNISTKADASVIITRILSESPSKSPPKRPTGGYHSPNTNSSKETNTVLTPRILRSSPSKSLLNKQPLVGSHSLNTNISKETNTVIVPSILRSGASKSVPKSHRVVGSNPLNTNSSKETNTAIAPGGLRSIINEVMAKSHRKRGSQRVSERVPDSQHVTGSDTLSGSQRVSERVPDFQRVTRSHTVAESQNAHDSQLVGSSQNASANSTNDSQPMMDSPNTANESNTVSTEVRAKGKKVRQKAQNKVLNDLLDCGGVKPPIEIPIGKKRPLGKWSQEFISELGIIVRQNIPLTIHYWKEMTTEQKIPLYKKLQSKFEVDMSKVHVREAVDDALKDRFKERRHRIHLYYLSIPEGVNKLEHPEKTVTQLEWESLCAHFKTEKFKKSCERNKKNRANPRVNHRGGRKAFICHRFDQRDPETGEEPDVVEFYRNMRWNAKKGWIAPEAEENYGKMLEIRSQSVEGDVELAETEILERVLGKRQGYVMGLGHGEVPPNRKSRIAYNEEELNQLRQRAMEQDQELNELRAWKASQEEISKSQQEKIEAQEELSKSQQEKIDAQAKKQEETDLLLNALKEKFGI